MVTREELRAHLWGGDTHVDFDRGLAYCIGQLRAALGDSADNPRFIQTLPRRGFSFIAPVAAADGDRSTFDVRRSALRFVVRRSAERRREASTLNANANDEPQNDERRTRTSNDARRSASGALLLATAVVFLTVAGGGWWARLARTALPLARSSPSRCSTTRPATRRASARSPPSPTSIVERLTALGPSRIGVNGNSKVLRNSRADRDPRPVARETHASFLVAGHLQTKDGRLSLLMHIIRLDDGTHVWVQRISRSPDDRLESLDEDVAAQIERAVRRIVLKDGFQVS